MAMVMKASTPYMVGGQGEEPAADDHTDGLTSAHFNQILPNKTGFAYDPGSVTKGRGGSCKSMYRGANILLIVKWRTWKKIASTTCQVLHT